MAEDELEDQEVQDEQAKQSKDWEKRLSELESQLSEVQSENKRLVTESKRYRERAQDAEFSRLKAKFPTLEKDDVAGLNADQVEKLLSKVSVSGSEETEDESSPGPDASVVEATKKFTEGAGGEAPAPPKTYSASEIRDIGIRDQAQALKLISEGRMKSP